MSEKILTMAELLKEAREKKLWLYTSYQGMWFSPDELEKSQQEGKFRWGPSNWELRDPIQKLQELEKNVCDAQKNVERFKIRAGI